MELDAPENLIVEKPSEADDPAVTRTDATAPLPYKLKAPKLGGHYGGITSCRFSPNGAYICSTSIDQSAIIWDVDRPLRKSRLKKNTKDDGHSGGLSDVAWHPTNDYVCTASDDNTIKIWDCETSDIILTLGSWKQDVRESHSDAVVCVDCNPQGSLIASGSSDMTVRLWEVRSGKCVQTIQAHSDRISSINFNADGTMFVTSSYDGIVRLWDSGSGLCLKSMVPGESRDDRVFTVTSACFSPNGKYILAGTMDNTLRLWETDTGKCVRTFADGHKNQHYANFCCFCKSNGEEVMTGSEDGSVSVYSIQTQKLVQSINIPGISGSVLGLDSHPTKTLLAVGGIRNTKSNMGQMCVDGKTNKSEKENLPYMLERMEMQNLYL